MTTSTQKIIFSVIAVGLLASCGQAKNEPAAASAEAAPAAAAPEMATRNTDVTTADKNQQLISTASTSPATDSDRKFIRTAQARFAVKDVYQSALAIEDAVAANGGFVTQNNISADIEKNEHYAKGDGNIIDISEYRVTGTLTVRVPSHKTQEFLRAIANQIEFLDMRHFEARDAQFDILRQKVITATANSSAERGDSRVTEKEFADQVAFATISLTLYQPNTVRKSEYADLNAAVLENRPSFFKRLGQSVATGWYGVLDVVLLLTHVWPLWAAIGLLWLGRRQLKTKRPEWFAKQDKKNEPNQP